MYYNFNAQSWIHPARKMQHYWCILVGDIDLLLIESNNSEQQTDKKEVPL